MAEVKYTNTYTKGVAAEFKMLEQMRELLYQYSIYDFEIITDLSYMSASGKFSQIDAILICNRGVFCIELKSWVGTLHMSKNSLWTLSQGRFEPVRNNSYMQNSKHTAVVRALLKQAIPELQHSDVNNLVVFDKKITLLNNPYDCVCMLQDTPNKIVSLGNSNLKDSTIKSITKRINEVKDLYYELFKMQQRGLANYTSFSERR